MEEPGAEVAFPTFEQIVEVNRRMIGESGGSFVPPDNLLNRTSLEYILAAIEGSVFGIDLFPTLKEKAAALAYEIISAHVFNDGCKRTGIHVAWSFLQANSVRVYLDNTIADLAVETADGHRSREDLLAWLHAHQDDGGSPGLIA